MSTLDEARHIIADALTLPADSVPSDGSMENLPEWDSIGHVRIILALETALGHPLPADAMLRATSVAAVAELLG